MTESSISIDIGGTDNSAAAFDASNAAIQKQAESLTQAKDQSKAASAAEIEGIKEATRTRQIQIRTADSLVKKNETLEEGFKRELRTLVVARRQQGDATGKYTETIERLKTKYREAAEEAQSASSVEVAASQAADKAVNDQIATAQRLVTKHQDLKVAYDQELAALKAAHAAGKISHKEYGETVAGVTKRYDELRLGQNQSFGSTSLTQVKNYAAGVLTIGTAFSVVRAILADYNKQLEIATRETDTLADARISLRQISKGDFDVLESQADALATDPTLGITREEARRLKFSARSTGFEGEERTVAAAAPVIKIEDGAAFAGEFRQFFKGEGMSIEEAFNTALAGTAESKLNITQLLPQIRTASQGQLGGGESSDVVAVASVLSNKFAEIGPYLKNLGVKLATTSDEIPANLIDAVKFLQTNPELRQAVLGESSELLAVYDTFSERMSEIVAADKRIEVAQRAEPGTGLLAQAVAEARDPNTESGRIEIARRRLIAAESREGVTKERDKSAEQLTDQAIQAEASARNAGFTARAVLSVANASGADLTKSGKLLENTAGILFGYGGPSAPAPPNAELNAQPVVDELKKTNDELKKLNRKNAVPAGEGV